MKKLRTRKIRGYNGLYSITENGDVISHRYGEKKLKLIEQHGYLHICLSNKDGEVKKHRVHTLVARAFCKGKSKKRNQINHIDGNKKNNNYLNLEYCTQQENITHAMEMGLFNQVGEENSNSTLTNDDVVDIRITYALGRNEGDFTMTGYNYLKDMYDYTVSKTCIGNIIRNDTWKHLPSVEQISKTIDKHGISL
jgi:hypothetical protein